MARYTCNLTVAVPFEQLQESLIEVLESCNFDIIYTNADYLMAREIPGQVPFGQLVTAEVLVDGTKVTDNEVHMNLVCKNEELPLQRDNHCRQLFGLVQQAVFEHRNWQLLDLV